MTKLVCQNNISSIFIVKFTIRSLENLKISDNIPPDRLNSWLDNTESEIKTVSVSRRKGCQVQWVCSYLILLLLYTTLHSAASPARLCHFSFFFPLFGCQVVVWGGGVVLKLSMFYITYYTHWHTLTHTYYKLSKYKLSHT